MTTTYGSNFSMDETARTCTEKELLSRAQLTALSSQANPKGNLATFDRRPVGSSQLNDIQIVAKGSNPPNPGTLMFSANIYVADAATDVDVYRTN